MSKGELVPDEVVIEMISFKIDNSPNAAGFLLMLPEDCISDNRTGEDA